MKLKQNSEILTDSELGRENQNIKKYKKGNCC